MSGIVEGGQKPRAARVNPGSTKPRWLLRSFVWMLAVLLGCAGFVAIGAMLAMTWGASPAGLVASYAIALFLSVVGPVMLVYRVAGKDPKLELSIWTVGLFGLLWLGTLFGFIPTRARAALAAHGDWFLAGHSVPAISESARAIAGWIPFGSAPDRALSPEGEESPALESAPVEHLRWSARELYANRAESVVMIRVRRAASGPLLMFLNEFGFGDLEAFGSGFIVSSEGLIVTNYHVIGDARSASVVLADGRIFSDVRVVAVDAKNDLGLLSVSGSHLSSTPVAPEDRVAIGERVFAIGSPFGLEHTLTEGIVSAKRDNSGTHVIQTQAPIAPGSSGGPLFDERGEVIGVNTFMQGAGLGFAVSADHVRDLLVAPRHPRVLSHYEVGPHVTDIEVSGETPPSPSTRGSMESWSLAIARVIGTCVERWDDEPLRVVLSQGRRASFGNSRQDADIRRCLGVRVYPLDAIFGLSIEGNLEGNFVLTYRVEGVAATAHDEGHVVLVELRTPG